MNPYESQHEFTPQHDCVVAQHESATSELPNPKPAASNTAKARLLKVSLIISLSPSRYTHPQTAISTQSQPTPCAT